MSILIYKQRHRHPNYKKTPKGNYAHIGYIATRPGAVKNEGMRHGLFGKLEPGVVKEFDTWQEAARLVRELSYRRVNMYRGTGPDKLRAVCSVVLDDCFLVKNVRVVEGEKGLFVSLPSRRNVKGEWVEHCFPMTKELRAKLSAAVLEAYEAAVQNEEAAVS